MAAVGEPGAKLSASLAMGCPPPPNILVRGACSAPREFELLELFGGLCGVDCLFNQISSPHSTTAYDMAEYLKDYYLEKFGPRGHYGAAGDLTKVDYKTFPPYDIIAAGSPCSHSCPGGSRKGIEHSSADLALLTCDIVIDQFHKGLLTVFLLESSGKAMTKYGGKKGVFQFMFDKLIAALGKWCEIRMLKLTGGLTGNPHNRTRCYILGVRADALCYGQVPDPLAIAAQDCYSYLNLSLPKTNLQDRKIITAQEELNIRAFLPKILDEILKLERKGKPVGLVTTFDISRKQAEQGGKFKASFKCNGEISSLTTKNAKVMITSNYDLKDVLAAGGSVENLDFARLMEIPERFTFQGPFDPEKEARQ